MYEMNIKELLAKYHLEDYLNGRLQYDEFIEDVKFLEKDALNRFIRYMKKGGWDLTDSVGEFLCMEDVKGGI